MKVQGMMFMNHKPSPVVVRRQCPFRFRRTLKISFLTICLQPMFFLSGADVTTSGQHTAGVIHTDSFYRGMIQSLLQLRADLSTNFNFVRKNWNRESLVPLHENKAAV